MEMPHKNKKYFSSPLLVSTDCSNFKSLYLTCRSSRGCFSHSKSSHHLPANPISKNHNPTSPSSLTPLTSPNCFKDGREAAQSYWRRAAQLESELDQLNKWLNIEKKLRDRLDNKNKKYSAVIDMGRTNHGCARNKLMRLADGGYLHRIKKMSMPYRKLAMQVSAPAIIPAETGSNASQVLHRMASMGSNNLINWLLKSMPMSDICGNHKEQIDGSLISSGSEEGFMEAIVLGAIKKMEILVWEGLRIQMGVKEMVKNEVALEKRNEERVGECVVIVMLIQLRNPEKEYEAAGEIMIGMVEASVPQVEGNGFLIEGVHVAGMSGEVILSNRREVKAGANYLWSVYMRGCQERCICSSGEYVRNPDIVFASGK